MSFPTVSNFCMVLFNLLNKHLAQLMEPATGGCSKRKKKR
jgi:hypothetical protein